MVHEGNGVVGCGRERRRRRGVPASRAIHRVCPHRRGGRSEVQWGREVEYLDRRGPGEEIEVGSQSGPKRTRRCSSMEVSDHGLVASITELMVCAPAGGWIFCTGIRAPRDEALANRQTSPIRVGRG